ncbi:hypothetical protein GCM10007159_42260 [Modicisalibacter luteus]|nr:hypothetical protein GCM10007159_42260 [Halomonas lutea]
MGLLEPDRANKADASAPKKRRQRKLKVYQNPNTNEVIQTRGGNHKTLKQWEKEFGMKQSRAGWFG